MTATIHDHARRRRTAHGLAWWLTIGWWWAPAAWSGRVVLWLVCWPLGAWRSWRHGQAKAERRARR